MSVALLPCEVYHREFDAKLILSAFLAGRFHIPSVIGYDKHFNALIPNLPPAILLDKSCSSIMWNSRILPALDRGGRVFISDEEGFNNLVPSEKLSAYNRVDREASRNISRFFCWGNHDFDFFSGIPELFPKLSIVGNCRSDLLRRTGRLFYKGLVDGLSEAFDDFVLCTDNFCVEHRDGVYVPPNYNTTPELNQLARDEFEARHQDQKRLRDFFARTIFESALALPSKQFVLRPHPCADPRWWTNKFWQLRNVHVISHHNVDPWLHAASCLVSIGCTTAIQSIITGTP